MGQVTYTPKPWAVSPLDLDIVIDKDGNCIAVCYHDMPTMQGDKCENAQLISAAPDLLEAATSMLLWFECLMQTDRWDGDIEDYNKLKDAVHKAQGRIDNG